MTLIAPAGSRRARRRERGVTIIELLVAVTVLGVIMSYALPNLRVLISNQRVRGVTTDMVASLIYARSEAIKRNAQVSVIPNGGDWQTGWTVQAGGTTLRAQDPLTGITVSGPVGNVTYRGNGRIPGSSQIQFTFRVTDTAAIKMRCVVIDPSGRPNLQLDNDSDTSNGCMT